MICCTNCGSGHYQSNWIEEAPYKLAAEDAELLRYLGHYDEVVRVLNALSMVRITNFIRPRWVCLSCGCCFSE